MNVAERTTTRTRRERRTRREHRPTRPWPGHDAHAMRGFGPTWR
jgi:hypothetical protein